MVGVLLAERAPADARVLVLGAGGGLELKALAETQPDWRLDGVDPSAEMLALARDPGTERIPWRTVAELLTCIPRLESTAAAPTRSGQSL